MKWYHGVGIIIVYFMCAWFLMAPIYDRQFKDCMSERADFPIYCKGSSEVEALAGALGWPFYYFIVTGMDRNK